MLEKGYKKAIIDADIKNKNKAIEFCRSEKIKKCASKVS